MDIRIWSRSCTYFSELSLLTSPLSSSANSELCVGWASGKAGRLQRVHRHAQPARWLLHETDMGQIPRICLSCCKHGSLPTAPRKSHTMATLKKQCRASRRRLLSYQQRLTCTSRECQTLLSVVKAMCLADRGSYNPAVLRIPNMRSRT